MISKELLNELQIILEEEFGLKTTPEQVFTIGSGLLGYFDLLNKYKYDDEETKKNIIAQEN